MARTAEEVHCDRILRMSLSDLYGFHGSNSFQDWAILMNRDMMFEILADTAFDNFFTEDERALMEGKLVIQS
jgi:hypothetical protein